MVDLIDGVMMTRTNLVIVVPSSPLMLEVRKGFRASREKKCDIA
jgi:hypothetical protein